MSEDHTPGAKALYNQYIKALNDLLDCRSERDALIALNEELVGEAEYTVRLVDECVASGKIPLDYDFPLRCLARKYRGLIQKARAIHKKGGGDG